MGVQVTTVNGGGGGRAALSQMSTCVTGLSLEGWPASGLQRQKCLLLIITKILKKRKGRGLSVLFGPGHSFGRVATDASGRSR